MWEHSCLSPLAHWRPWVLGTRDFRGTETARGLWTGQTGSRRVLTLASLPAAWPWGILSFRFSSVKGDDDNMQLLQEVTREGDGDLVFTGWVRCVNAGICIFYKEIRGYKREWGKQRFKCQMAWTLPLHLPSPAKWWKLLVLISPLSTLSVSVE